MKIAGDTHTHTLICQHAYSTLKENIDAARSLGQRFLVTTEHGPHMKGGPSVWFFGNIRKAVPRELDGVVVIKGCEANVLDTQGTIDIQEPFLSKLDMVMVSMHEGEFDTAHTPEECTQTWCNVAKNPMVDVIGHLGDPRYQSDYEKVIQAVKAGGQAVEINASSSTSRPGSEENCPRILELCKKYEVPVVLSSDAHFYTAVGRVEWAIELVERMGYPEEWVLNADYGRFRAWLMARKGIDDLPE